ncbi:MAG: tRNA pseudouridine(38-40) synthase TruA [Pirellulaceae bacterium]
MRSFKLILAYDGTHFTGWQRQPRRRTVQGVLEKTLEQILQEEVRCLSSGRTDSGVHALAQVVTFQSITEHSPEAITKALNAELPEDVFVFEACVVPDKFHPIKDAIRKRYRYVIQDGRVRDIFDRQYVWQVFSRLNVEAMQQAAKHLVGTHDFISFEAHGSSRLTTVRTIYDLLVERREAERTDRVIIEVEADGFLYNMVRIIAGTLMLIGKGKHPSDWPLEILAAKDRRVAGMTAPPQGLFLMWVEYGQESETIKSQIPNNAEAESTE